MAYDNLKVEISFDLTRPLWVASGYFPCHCYKSPTFTDVLISINCYLSCKTKSHKHIYFLSDQLSNTPKYNQFTVMKKSINSYIYGSKYLPFLLEK